MYQGIQLLIHVVADEYWAVLNVTFTDAQETPLHVAEFKRVDGRSCNNLPGFYRTVYTLVHVLESC